MYSYSIAGLDVLSELAIPAAVPNRDCSMAKADVTIKWGTTQASIPDAWIQNDWLEVGDRAFKFRPKEGLTFLVRHGREITISRTPDVTDEDVLLYLGGSALGVLCHQRRLLPLHCSAVVSGNQAIAFMGPSGAGKSTLAAGLSKRGYLHLCDDVCVALLADRKAQLSPMPKGLKLWGDTSHALAMPRGGRVSSDRSLDKYFVSIPTYHGEAPLEISALYVLSIGSTGQPNFSPLRGSDKFQAILSNVYRCEWLSWIRDPADVFRQVTELANCLPVYRFSRPWDMSSFEAGLDALETHMGAITTDTRESEAGVEARRIRAAG